jgi:hypothetical protein
VDKRGQEGKAVQSLLPQRIEGVQTPRNADERTLRMCFTEQDAIDGLDTAMVWLEADLRRLERSLDAGIEIPTLGAMYAAMRRYGD